MTREQIVAEIESYAAARRIAPATVTSRAVGNSRLYHRLTSGAGCTLAIAERLLAYMASNPAQAGQKDGQ